MKRFLLGSFGLLILGIGGCKRSDNTDVTLPSNGWLVNGNVYHVKDAICFSGAFRASDSLSNNVTVNFWSTPTVDKVYKIVKVANTTDLKQDEVSIYFFNGRYFGNGNEIKTLTVKMTNGRVNVSVPEIWLKDEFSNDSLRFAAQMVETRLYQ